MMKVKQKRSVIIMGGAIGDIVLGLDKLPLSGQDIVATPAGQQIGGCAFNIARVLRKLDLTITNGIAVGCGSWGSLIEQQMQQLELPILFRHQTKDNGWCLAFVEPSGERTFVTVEGCETDWQSIPLSSLEIDENSIVYVSGYELVGESSKPLQKWLLNLPQSVLRFIDPGPRLPDIDKQFMQTLLCQYTVLTLNRDEIALLCHEYSGDPIEQVQHFIDAYPITIIARLDSHGAWLCHPNEPAVYIEAYQVEVVDTIGAGDAHCGGVIAGLALGYTFADSVRLGNKIAAIIVNRCGADNPPTLSELRSFNFVKMFQDGCAF